MRHFIFFAISIVFNAVANVLIKIGMDNIEQTKNLWQLFKKAILNPAILLGVACFTLGFVFYCFLLTRENLSIAYPIVTSVGYMMVIAISWLWLRETLIVSQMIGFILIMAGVWLVAK